MSKAHKVLRVKVGESIQDAGARAAAVMRALAEGKAVQPHFGVSFAQMAQMLAAFTPKRWETDRRAARIWAVDRCRTRAPFGPQLQECACRCAAAHRVDGGGAGR